MSKKFHVTQEDIQDVLLARGKKANTSTLTTFARDKGIIISQDDTRDTLARYVSTLPFDYHDIAKLYDTIEQDQRREKTTSQKIKSKIEDFELRGAISTIRDDSPRKNDTFTIISESNAKTFVLDIEYDEEDFSKARMLQTIRKKSRIEICMKDNEALIRHPANEKCGQIVANILNIIKTQKSEPVEIEKIELSNITTPGMRNSFFEHILQKCKGLTRQNVISVKISRMQHEDSDGTEDATPNDEEIPAPCFIKKVALEGESLLAQEEYLAFLAKGFFISNMAWQAEDQSSSLLVELEAGFANQADCKDFKYDVKAIYSIEKESGVISQQRKSASHIDRLKYLDMIERAATESMKEVSL